jgi:lysophospholipase L1-like esterase
MNRFPDGARVAFIGDSLVAANQTLARIVDFYGREFPDSGIRFFNCGISGGTAATARRFLTENVLVHRPTHAVIATGINDSRSSALSRPRGEEKLAILTKAYEEYRENLTALTESLLDAGAQVTLCTPAPYDEYGTHDSTPLPGGSGLMVGYAGFVRQLAAQKGLPLCDYHACLTKAMQTDSLYSGDRVHPTPHGYYTIAKVFLAFQGLSLPEEAPLPEYLLPWHEKVLILRRIFGAEYMILKDRSMTMEEKIGFVKEKLAAKSWDNPAHESFGQVYAEYKAQQPEIEKEIIRLYEKDILGHYGKE